MRIAETLAESIWISAYARSWEAIVNMLAPDDRDRISSAAMINLLDLFATSNEYFKGENGSRDFRALNIAADAMSKPTSVARVFTHAGCVDEPREFLLQRFEELVLHDGKHVFLTLLHGFRKTGSTSTLRPLIP